MRTKKGDMVRVCFRAYRGLPAELSYRLYKVASVGMNGTICVTSSADRHPITVRSWVRCADMKDPTP